MEGMSKSVEVQLASTFCSASEKPSKSRLVVSGWRIATFAGVVLYLLFTCLYFFWGLNNADEGAYLYVSHLVFEGKLPYRDFAYVQMPLFIYIYGIPQVVIHPSLYIGRATSILFSLANLGLCILLARRYAGEIGGGLTALLLGTFTYGIYFETIVKTYAPLSFFFSLTFFVLSSKLADKWKYPLAATFAICAGMVRLSAIMFIVPVIVYSLMVTPKKSTKLAVMAVCVAAIVVVLFFLTPDFQAASWGLFATHLAFWGPLPVSGRLINILLLRIPTLIYFYGLYALLILVMALLACRSIEIRNRIKSFVLHNTAVLVITIGLTLFALSHLGTGSWYFDYFVPAATSFFPIIAIMLSRIYTQAKNSPTNLLLSCTLVATLLLAPVRHGHGMDYIDISGDPPFERIREVAACVAQNSTPSDKLFALEALCTAIDSHRSTLPGLTLVQYSVQNVSSEKAKELKVVNGEIVLEYIKTGAAKIVVLTDLDRYILKKSGQAELIRRALADQYELILTTRGFRLDASKVYVYHRRAAQ